MAGGKLFGEIMKTVFPDRCCLCGRVTRLEDGVCRNCRKAEISVEEPVCKTCGRGFEYCTCREGRFFSGIGAPFYYTGPVRNGIGAYKFRHKRARAEMFTLHMARSVTGLFPEVDFDCVVSVPLSESKRKSAEYDHAAVLACELAERLNVPYIENGIIKIFETQDQHFLSGVMKKGNVFGVFDIPDPERFKGKTVLLCDDVCTSGNTLNECAKMLYLADAAEIYCAVVAVTKGKKK